MARRRPGAVSGAGAGAGGGPKSLAARAAEPVGGPRGALPPPMGNWDAESERGSAGDPRATPPPTRLVDPASRVSGRRGGVVARAPSAPLRLRRRPAFRPGPSRGKV